MMLSLDEIGLLPSSKPTSINSRAIIDPFIHNTDNPESKVDRYPIFVSPMTSVICKENVEYFENTGFIPILPRTGEFEERIELCKTRWTAFSLQEFLDICEKDLAKDKQHMYILVDIANGHIGKLYTYARELKEKYPQVILMVGNIAHPKMYIECCNAGIDYVRVGIGGGSVCSTSVQCGVHASHVYMIEEINKLKKLIPNPCTKLIADGGINTFDRAIKCLALGYDYVMMGKIFAQSYIACGEVRTTIETHNGEKVYINFDIINRVKDSRISGQFKEAYLERKYYGMASEQGQIDISGGANKNPEGIETWVKIEYPIEEIKSKFEAALRSTMSYVGATTLYELSKKAEYAPMSISEFKSYYK